MSYLNTRVLDRGLEILIAETDALILTSEDPLGDFAAALGARIAFAAYPSVTGPQNGDEEGSRSVIVQPIADGDVEADGTATHWSLISEASARLLAAGELANPLPVLAHDTFTLESISITLFGPAVAAPGGGVGP